MTKQYKIHVTPEDPEPTRHAVLQARQELVEMGLVRDSGERRNGQIVWELTARGRAAAGIRDH